MFKRFRFIGYVMSMPWLLFAVEKFRGDIERGKAVSIGPAELRGRLELSVGPAFGTSDEFRC